MGRCQDGGRSCARGERGGSGFWDLGPVVLSHTPERSSRRRRRRPPARWRRGELCRERVMTMAPTVVTVVIRTDRATSPFAMYVHRFDVPARR